MSNRMNSEENIANHSAEELRHEAARCRRLASSALDRRTLDALQGMASEYDEQAERLNASG